MKKVLIAVMILLTSVTYASSGGGKHGKERENEKGGHISVSQVPGYILAQFNAMFAGATNVKWEAEKEHGRIEYKAEFYINGQKMKARF